jgi:hypothetical protein
LMKAAAIREKAKPASHWGEQRLRVRALTKCRYVTFRGWWREMMVDQLSQADMYPLRM